MRTVAVVQARMNSSRLNGKVLRKIGKETALSILLHRLKNAKSLDDIVVATSKQPENDILENYVIEQGFKVYRGSEADVLGRVVCAAEANSAEVIVRITGDCPLVDSEIVDQVVKKLRQNDLEYVSNTLPATYPDGLDVEAVKFSTLKQSIHHSLNKSYREHVTKLIRESDCSKANIEFSEDLSGYRLTLDEVDDLKMFRLLEKQFGPLIHISWREAVNFLKSYPSRVENQFIIRDEGQKMTNGQKLYNRAKQLIPGGNMLLSKRPEMFLPNIWPSYFSKASGCEIWDIDGNHYLDLSIMGIGTNTLGYGHPVVDERVMRTVSNGNMSTLNCPEEVYLAEKLLQLNSWADKVRFARTGGEANAIAIRIARAASGLDGVAVCGYHGWHDWYLAANLNKSDELQKHLLPGLQPDGVPANLKDSTFTFEYNRFDQLEALVKKKSIGVIKMEVQRNKPPKDDFLIKVRKLCDQNNIILIFDECTSGFRETFGGLFNKYNVVPDITIFGKALGNGYAITAVLGKDEIMQAAQRTFISSTFWTERIGSTAALATLDVMEEEKSWEKITQIGSTIKQFWQRVAKENGYEIETWGLDALAGFTVKCANPLAIKTFITQEMLKQGILASNMVYTCTAHTDNVLDQYFDKFSTISKQIPKLIEASDPIEFLDGPVCHGGFSRLN